jgi:hypothetical protein
MTGFPAPGKEKNQGKTAARAVILALGYPHALEKSQYIECGCGALEPQPDRRIRLWELGFGS